GGAAYMNAGVAGGYFSSVVESVLVYAKGELKRLGVKECAYSYKKSRFMQSGETILGVFLSLTSATVEEIEEKRNQFLQRRSALPKGKSLGCIFKNPAQKSAGAFIEGAGLKGLRVGGAVISPMHANFIINEKNATVEDVCTLIKTIKNAVYAQYGVQLEEEIEYLS
ncbi:MAG: UDP-N-acetylenolpyruvoylglucosamine reductase, partial [Clostridia bacterium]|nr:UDP-N-acetylenolpyruvoylglucosamine reductase [Clostridia bacterium]